MVLGRFENNLHTCIFFCYFKFLVHTSAFSLICKNLTQKNCKRKETEKLIMKVKRVQGGFFLYFLNFGWKLIRFAIFEVFSWFLKASNFIFYFSGRIWTAPWRLKKRPMRANNIHFEVDIKWDLPFDEPWSKLEKLVGFIDGPCSHNFFELNKQFSVRNSTSAGCFLLDGKSWVFRRFWIHQAKKFCQIGP